MNITPQIDKMPVPPAWTDRGPRRTEIIVREVKANYPDLAEFEVNRLTERIESYSSLLGESEIVRLVSRLRRDHTEHGPLAVTLSLDYGVVDGSRLVIPMSLPASAADIDVPTVAIRLALNIEQVSPEVVSVGISASAADMPSTTYFERWAPM